MKLLAQVRRCMILGATIGLLMPQMTIAGGRIPNTPIRDVALQQGGTLHGSLISAQGRGAAGETISMTANGELVARAIVGSDGKFVVTGLQPGVYSIFAGETQRALRLWSDGAAPPSATSELRLVSHQSRVVRGMHGDHLPQWDHPILVGGLLAVAGVIGGIIGYNIKDDAS
ncbi:MAG: carboxypeptidase regulatory-like domain-containing protein [Planctomycetes bacterium]|nr:carboxypeptidase regulatory-like domain-containing protein [Planctomycetota bacterium]